MAIGTEEYRLFLRSAAQRPTTIGAIVPSGCALAARLAAIVPTRGAPTVVELGPGTGTVSTAIRRRLSGDGRQLAVELDADMVAYLRRSHPWLTVLHGDAADLHTILAAEKVSRADAIVSGLPWSLFDRARQHRMLDAICHTLGPNGAFTTFAYVHALPLSGARGFRSELESRFDEVVATRTVWRNLPPALVYVCRRVVDRA